jgi:hypothetical protein
VATLTVVVGYAAIAGLARPFTLPADLAAAVAGTAVLVMARLAGPAVPGRPRPSGAGWWALLAGTVVVLELVEFFGGARASHPTLSSLVGPALACWPARSAAYAGWLWFGRALARR